MNLKLRLHIFFTKLLLLVLSIIGFSPVISSQTYFQQQVNYKIAVTLNDTLHELKAFEEIEYTNNSPDTLQFMYFHLWPNAYSNNKTQLAKQIFTFRGKQKLFNDPELRGFIDSLKFKIDNSLVQWNLLPNQIDICKIQLNKPLCPGKTIIITTPFHVKIPKGVTSRLGHIEQSYQISQWFPKPAVYDKTGWHQMSYLDQGEFYSEFGRFDVRITLPANYVVAATGELQDKNELEKLNILATDTTWKNIAMLGKVKHIKSSRQTKTLHYSGSNMHDFAWFADKEFHVMKGKVILPESGREVTTWVMCTNRQSRLWKQSLVYTNKAILDFSNIIGDYPYPCFTTVQSALSAGLGMEYPGLAVIGKVKDAYSLDNVITHEAAHSWFYGALGSNERRYPYLDESITANYEQRHMQNEYPNKKLWEMYLKKKKQARFFQIENMPIERLQELSWLTMARNNQEQPLNLSSTDYTEETYSSMIYGKASTSFSYLRAYLSDSVYDTIMHDYYKLWRFRHPQPNDLRQAFESHTDKDLAWFFGDMLGSTKSLDYKIIQLRNNQLLVKNNGEMISPVIIAGMKKDSVCFEKWIVGFSGKQWIDIPQGNYTEIKIDPNHVMPELFRLNNNIRTTGIFPKSDSIVPQLLLSIEDPEKRTIMYIPAVNWNHENGFMVGIALNNGILIPKPVEYFFMPFYTFTNSTLAGYGRIAYNITPYNSFIQKVTISVDGTRFGAPGNKNFQKLKAGIEINFRPEKATSPIRQKVYTNYIVASDLLQIENEKEADFNSYLQVGYQIQKVSAVNPFKMSALIESGNSFQKAGVEFKYKLSYTGKRNGLEIRAFAGTMIKSATTATYYNLAPGGRSGREQYLYEGIYPDRFGVFSQTIWSRQMAITEGGIVSPINEQLGYSKWLFSLSLISSLPGKASLTGIKPFVNLLINDRGLSANQNSKFFGEAGLKISLLNIVELYFPLLVTANIRSISPFISDRIRIVLNLDFSEQKLNSNEIGD